MCCIVKPCSFPYWQRSSIILKRQFYFELLPEKYVYLSNYTEKKIEKELLDDVMAILKYFQEQQNSCRLYIRIGF